MEAFRQNAVGALKVDRVVHAAAVGQTAGQHQARRAGIDHRIRGVRNGQINGLEGAGIILDVAVQGHPVAVQRKRASTGIEVQLGIIIAGRGVVRIGHPGVAGKVKGVADRNKRAAPVVCVAPVAVAGAAAIPDGRTAADHQVHLIRDAGIQGEDVGTGIVHVGQRIHGQGARVIDQPVGTGGRLQQALRIEIDRAAVQGEIAIHVNQVVDAGAGRVGGAQIVVQLGRAFHHQPADRQSAHHISIAREHESVRIERATVRAKTGHNAVGLVGDAAARQHAVEGVFAVIHAHALRHIQNVALDQRAGADRDAAGKSGAIPRQGQRVGAGGHVQNAIAGQRPADQQRGAADVEHAVRGSGIVHIGDYHRTDDGIGATGIVQRGPVIHHDDLVELIRSRINFKRGARLHRQRVGRVTQTSRIAFELQDALLHINVGQHGVHRGTDQAKETAGSTAGASLDEIISMAAGAQAGGGRITGGAARRAQIPAIARRAQGGIAGKGQIGQPDVAGRDGAGGIVHRPVTAIADAGHRHRTRGVKAIQIQARTGRDRHGRAGGQGGRTAQLQRAAIQAYGIAGYQHRTIERVGAGNLQGISACLRQRTAAGKPIHQRRAAAKIKYQRPIDRNRTSAERAATIIVAHLHRARTDGRAAAVGVVGIQNHGARPLLGDANSPGNRTAAGEGVGGCIVAHRHGTRCDRSGHIDRGGTGGAVIERHQIKLVEIGGNVAIARIQPVHRINQVPISGAARVRAGPDQLAHRGRAASEHEVNKPVQVGQIGGVGRTGRRNRTQTDIERAIQRGVFDEVRPQGIAGDQRQRHDVHHVGGATEVQGGADDVGGGGERHGEVQGGIGE